MKIKINYNSIFIALLLFPFFEPDYLATFRVVDVFYQLWMVVSFFVILLMYIYMILIKRRLPSLCTIIILIINFNVFIITQLNDNMDNSVFKNILIIMSFCFVVDMFSSCAKNLLTALMVNLEIIIYLNFITIVLFPQGLYHLGLYMDNWFLGYANSEVKILICGILVALLYQNYFKSKVRAYFLIGISILTVIILQVWTGIIGMSVMLLIYIVLRRRSKLKSRFINLKNIFILAGCVFFIFIVQGKIVGYVDFIAKYTGKTGTFTSRFAIWKKTLEMWEKAPLFGYGCKTTTLRGIEYSNIYATHAHNTFLEYLYQGGIIGILLYIILICIIASVLYKNYNNNSSLYFTVIIGGFLFMMMSEAYIFPIMYLMYSLAYHATVFEKNNNS